MEDVRKEAKEQNGKSYPFQLFMAVFGEKSEAYLTDCVAAEQVLDEIIAERLSEDEAETLRLIYKEGKTREEIAAARGVEQDDVRMNEACALRKLRHPASSKRLRPFLKVLDEIEQ